MSVSGKPGAGSREAGTQLAAPAQSLSVCPSGHQSPGPGERKQDAPSYGWVAPLLLCHIHGSREVSSASFPLQQSMAPQSIPNEGVSEGGVGQV